MSVRVIIASTALLVALYVATSADADPVQDGAHIASSGSIKGAPPCSGCHGANGAGDPTGMFPALAAQSPLYLKDALRQFAGDLRKNAIMGPIAKQLAPQEIHAVAAYYASLRAASTTPQASSSGADKGRIIASEGLEKKEIPACAACHGPFGHSVEPNFPSLAGLNARYIGSELKLFRSGGRGLQNGVMTSIASGLDDQEIEDLASYYQEQGSPSVSQK